MTLKLNDLDDNPETKKAWRIASMFYAAKLLAKDGFHDAAKHMNRKATALKFGVPDGHQSFDDHEPSCEIRIEHNQDEVAPCTTSPASSSPT